MTAVPAVDGARVEVICDQCGEVTVADGCGIHDGEVVYVALGAIGWGGAAFAGGPHRCPSCDAHTATARSRTSSPAGPAPAVRVSLTLLPSAAIVRVLANVGLEVVAELRVILEQAARARSRVVVDLARVQRIDSAGLGTLVRARNAARRRCGVLVLAAPSRFVLTALRTMRLHTAFPVFGTVGQAVEASRVPRSA